MSFFPNQHQLVPDLREGGEPQDCVLNSQTSELVHKDIMANGIECYQDIQKHKDECTTSLLTLP